MRTTTAILLLLFTHNLNAQIILTEVMFDPIGSESTDEFIEIYNIGQQAVDLSGFRVGDQNSQELLIFPDGDSFLQPEQFAVIFDADYFESSSTYENRVPATALQITVDDRTLGSGGLLNSQPETVILLDSVGEVIAEYTYSPDNQPGHSDEKVDPQGGDNAENWQNSLQENGTPGASNSVSPAQFDLAIDAESISWQPGRPRRTEMTTIEFSVQNVGIESITLEKLQIFIDSNADSLFAPDELADEIDVMQAISAQSAFQSTWQWQPHVSGIHAIRMTINAERDARASNDSVLFQVPVGFLPNDLVINEIMAAPANESAEWIELLNISAAPINLDGWQVGDANSVSQPIDETIFLQPEEFLLLSASGNITQIHKKNVKINGWPALNNDEDRIRLLDFNKAAIDSLHYQLPAGSMSGTSLERINPRLPANESSNWGPSVAVSGATPGEKNSIFTEIVPAQSTLTAQPNPFSPDADGVDDVAIISYDLPLLQSQVNLTIYDLRGRIVRKLLNNAPSGATRQIIWNGTADNGRHLPVGIYVIHLQAIDAGTGKMERANTTIVLAQKL